MEGKRGREVCAEEAEHAAKRARVEGMKGMEGKEDAATSDSDSSKAALSHPPTTEQLRAMVLAYQAQEVAEGTLLPPLTEPFFPVIMLGVGVTKAPTLGDTIEPTVQPLTAIRDLKTRHALPTRPLDTTYADVVDAEGALVPAPPAVFVRMEYFDHVDDKCIGRGLAAEDVFRVAVEAHGWRTRNVAQTGAGFEDVNVKKHVDLMIRGDIQRLAKPLVPAAAATEDKAGDAETTADDTGNTGNTDNTDTRANGKERELWVDVKALRNTARGRRVYNTHVVAELHAAGCLQHGQSDVFAYEVFNPNVRGCLATDAQVAAARAFFGLPDDGSGDDGMHPVFVLLDRLKLRDWVCAALDMEAPPVAFPEQSAKRLYSRKDGARSIITNLPLEEAYAAAGCGVLSW